MKNIFKLFLSVAVLVAAIGYSARSYAQESESYKIMSFNIRMSDGSQKSDGDNHWLYRKEAILKMIAELQPHAIGMQEVCHSQKEYLDKHLDGYKGIGIGRDDGKKRGEVMAIYYKKSSLKLLDWGTLWLSETPEEVSRGWDAACHRTLTWALFRDKATGEKWAMINTHLDHLGPEARREGMRLIAAKAEEFIGQGMAVVVTADFNATTDEDIFAPLYRVMEDARKEADAADQGMTYNGWGKEYLQIDHIFYKGWKAERFDVIEDDFGVPYISDHYPLLVTLKN